MSLCWKEFVRTMRKNSVMFLLNLIGIISVLFITAFSVSYYLDKKVMGEELQDSYQGKVFYKIVYDGEIGELYQNIFRTERICNVKQAFEELSAKKEFDYRYSDPGCVTILQPEGHQWKQEMLYGYEKGKIDENYTVVKAVYADKSLMLQKSVELAQGETFDNSDYLITDKSSIELPIILGNEYSERFVIGEKIESVNLWDETEVTLVVSGFLKKGSYFYDNNNVKVLLDRYLILPDIEIAYTLEGNILDDSFFLGAYDGIKLMNARVICDKEDEEQVKKLVKSILNKNKLYDFYIHEETAGAYRVYENAKQFVILSFVIVCITFVVCLIMMAIGTMAKLFKERKAYAIYSLLGFEKKKIFHIAVFDQIITFVVADIFMFICFAIMYWTEYDVGIFRMPIYGTLLLLEALLFLVTTFLVVKMVNRQDMSDILRGKE